MKVVVLGSGVIGVTTAYYLARAGAEVTVIDRQDGPALDTSFANAGQVSFGYSTPWGALGIPMKALKWMFEKHAPLSIRPDGSLFQLRWMAQMLRNCSTERYAVNKERMLRLSNYSRQCIAQLRADTGIEYEGRQAGTLQLFRSQKQVDQAQRDIAVLQECGIDYELLDPQGVARAEPALARADATIAGGHLGVRLDVDLAVHLEAVDVGGARGRRAAAHPHPTAADSLWNSLCRLLLFVTGFSDLTWLL